ncbi:MAG: S1/P1 nuclease [Pseudobdellovibrionaceae bacterium]
MTMLISTQGWTWGGVGHWTIARLADEIVSASAENEIKQIIKRDETLMSVSTLPDSWRYKAEWKHTYDYHFDTVAVGKNYLEQLKTLDPESIAKGGVTQAVLQTLKILKNRQFNSNPESIRQALIFMIHFVSDIHQPLHVGRVGDKGGNDVKLKWMGKKTNLHSIWDHEMIATSHSDFVSGNEVIQNSKKYADYLKVKFQNTLHSNSEFSRSDRSILFTDNEVAEWVVESIQLRDQLYVGYDGNQAQYQRKFSSSQDYRIFLAGQRLGRILNGLFDRENDITIQGRFRQMIEQIVGKIDEIIQLTPKYDQGYDVSDLDNRYAEN